MTILPRILFQSYLEVPDQIAVYLLHPGQPDRAVTCRELVEGAAAYARLMNNAGLLPGEPIVLILQHGFDLVCAFYGAMLHGAIPAIMPFLTEKLQPEKYRGDLAALIEVTRPAAILTYPEFASEAQAAVQPGSPVRAVLVSDQVHHPVADPPGSFARTSLDPSQFSGLACQPEEIVLLQHSSGTTGLQKGVALSHQAVLNQLESYRQALGLNAQDVIVSWLPLYHDMGLIAGFILPILLRTPLVLMSPFEWVRAPYRLMQAVSRYRGTLTWLPNFAYQFCAHKVRERDLQGVDLSTWRGVINCSEPVHWESHRSFIERFQPFGLRPEALSTCYAMAENVFAVTQSPLGQPPLVEVVDRDSLQTKRIAAPARTGQPAIEMMSCGPTIQGVEIRILDEHGCDLPDRRIGEVAIRSNCMLTGYYHRPDATEKAFLDGWYLTGDYGYKVRDELFVTGRKKDLIIVGGKNIYPQDIEAIANQSPGVHPGRVVAFGVYDEETGTEEVVVLAEADVSSPDERQRIADDLRARVTRGSDIALRQVEIVDSQWLIKTSSGKIARSANREKYLANRGELHQSFTQAA